MNEDQIRFALNTIGDAIHADDSSWVNVATFQPIEGRMLVVHVRGGPSVNDVVRITLNTIPRCLSAFTTNAGLTMVPWSELAAFGLMPTA